MSDYILALCTRHNNGLEKILLVLKNKPDWQKGHFNLPGGKIEGDETPEDTAIREVIEETGYNPLLQPVVMGILKDGDNKIYCLKVLVQDNGKPKPRLKETEKVFWMSWYGARVDSRIIPNLKVIIPLMQGGLEGWEIEDQYRKTTGPFHSIKVRIPT